MTKREFLQETNFQNDVNLDAESVEDTKKANRIKEKYYQWAEEDEIQEDIN